MAIDQLGQSMNAGKSQWVERRALMVGIAHTVPSSVFDICGNNNDDRDLTESKKDDVESNDNSDSDCEVVTMTAWKSLPSNNTQHVSALTEIRPILESRASDQETDEAENEEIETDMAEGVGLRFSQASDANMNADMRQEHL